MSYFYFYNHEFMIMAYHTFQESYNTEKEGSKGRDKIRET